MAEETAGTSAEGTVRLSSQLVGAAIGSTTPSIAAVPRIETGAPQTGLAERHAGTHWRIARPVPANSSASREAIWLVIGVPVAASATALAAAALGTGQAVELVRATGQVVELVRATGRAGEELTA